MQKAIPDFLRHVWAFDVVAATGADRDSRSSTGSRPRNQFRSDSATFRQFIEGLQLVVSVAALSPADYDRAAPINPANQSIQYHGNQRGAFSALLESGERKASILFGEGSIRRLGPVELAMFTT